MIRTQDENSGNVGEPQSAEIMVSSIFVIAARLGLPWPWPECSPRWVALVQVLAPEHHSDSDYVQLYAEHDIAGESAVS
eukprot:COSAG01_NODE_25567_length_740_cov_55.021841_1_plen_78_part_10